MSSVCTLTLNASQTLPLANEDNDKWTNGGIEFVFVICIVRLQWKRSPPHKNIQSLQLLPLWVYLVESPLPESRLDAETGAQRSSHPDGGRWGPKCCPQHVGSVCYQMETCAGKRYLTLSKKRGKKWWSGKKLLICNGTKDIEIEKERDIINRVFILIFTLGLNIIHVTPTKK